jgi:hypothetical protein
MFFLAMGYGIALPQDAASPFSPPFSNNKYSCRCLPCFDKEIYRSISLSGDEFNIHHKFCELRSYVRALDEHIQFVYGIVDGSLNDSADWLLQQSKKKNIDNGVSVWLCKQNELLQTSGTAFKSEIATILKRFPFDTLSQKMQSMTVRVALEDLHITGSANKLNTAWKALVAFAMEEPASFESVFAQDRQVLIPHGDASVLEKDLWCAFICTKDMADLMYVLSAFFAHVCAESCSQNASKSSSEIESFIISSKNADQYALVNMIDIYAAVNTLPLESTLKSISRFMKKFAIAIKKLQEKADNNFVGWLKSKWVYIPLAVGVIVIKTVQYFWISDDNSEASSNPFLDDNFVDEYRGIVIDNG